MKPMAMVTIVIGREQLEPDSVQSFVGRGHLSCCLHIGTLYGLVASGSWLVTQHAKRKKMGKQIVTRRKPWDQPGNEIPGRVAVELPNFTKDLWGLCQEN